MTRVDRILRGTQDFLVARHHVAAELYTALLIAKDYRFYTSPLRAASRAVFNPTRRVLCTPHSLRMGMFLPKIFAVNGYRPVFDETSPYDFSIGVPVSDGKLCINCDHIDNRKSRVAHTWQKVAGYPLTVNPAEYSGRMVEKSEDNSTHDGRVVQGPLSADEIDENKAYQLLIDNSKGGQVVDYRVPIYGDRIPLVYLKERPISVRFESDNTTVEIKDASDLLSDQEITLLVQFAKESGLQYAEVDVLRDNGSGRIYVVDSSNGPGGPPHDLTMDATIEAIHRLSIAFDEMIDQSMGE